GSPTPDDIDFLDFVILFRSIFREGFGRPRAGIRPILNRLARQFRSFGGELKLNCGVRRITHDGRRVDGVTLDDGRHLQANTVLSSAGLVETLQLCQAPAEVRRQHQPGQLSFIEMICCLDCQPADLGIQRTIVFFNSSPRVPYHCPDEPVELGCGVICCPNNFQYDQPLDDGRVRVTVLANPRFWLEVPDESYTAEKQKWESRIVDAACRIVPDFRSRIVDTDMFTPRTVRRFTGHVNGAVYGAPVKVRDGRTHLEGLYLCGTDQGYLGIVGSMLSGITVANLYLLR
ncbi:MAG TPA: NAD(P)/FAD-dependent oxidoreductase, partial [Planctomycetaceae bacterium]|nr:NAD(P)/FAD-dependent oxidoreductase [Planctomycetaceae bacterium]